MLETGSRETSEQPIIALREKYSWSIHEEVEDEVYDEVNKEFILLTLVSTVFKRVLKAA